jgi:hypothetical protein
MISSEMTGYSSLSIRICSGFVFCRTCSDADYIGLSGATKSRFTIISVAPHRMNVPLLLSSDEFPENNDLKIMTKNFLKIIIFQVKKYFQYFMLFCHIKCSSSHD